MLTINEILAQELGQKLQYIENVVASSTREIPSHLSPVTANKCTALWMTPL